MSELQQHNPFTAPGALASARREGILMRTMTHDRPVNFRAHVSLIAAAEQRAARKGMSLSEFMRHALRRELEAA